MNQRAILAQIEKELIGTSNIKRRPFGLDCIYNIAKAITYLYDKSHLNGYHDIQEFGGLWSFNKSW